MYSTQQHFDLYFVTEVLLYIKNAGKRASTCVCVCVCVVCVCMCGVCGVCVCMCGVCVCFFLNTFIFPACSITMQ